MFMFFLLIFSFLSGFCVSYMSVSLHVCDYVFFGETGELFLKITSKFFVCLCFLFEGLQNILKPLHMPPFGIDFLMLLGAYDLTTASNLIFVYSFMLLQLNCVRDVIFHSYWVTRDFSLKNGFCSLIMTFLYFNSKI